MDVSKIIGELRSERAEVERAIASLERLSGLRQVRRPLEGRQGNEESTPIARESAAGGK